MNIYKNLGFDSDFVYYKTNGHHTMSDCVCDCGGDCACDCGGDCAYSDGWIVSSQNGDCDMLSMSNCPSVLTKKNSFDCDCGDCNCECDCPGHDCTCIS